MMATGAHFPSITAWKVSNTLGSFSFLRSNSSLVCFGLLIFSGKGRRSSSASRDHFQCLLLESFVFRHCSHLIRSTSSLECNLVVVLPIWAMPCPSSGFFVMTKSVCRHKIVRGGKLQKSESSLICVVTAEGSTNVLPVLHKHPRPLLHQCFNDTDYYLIQKTNKQTKCVHPPTAICFLRRPRHV